MDTIEKAIRTAFEKGDPSERSFREKVYRSAFSALDKALQSNPNVTQEVVARRRQALSATISQIESEFIPAVSVEPERRSSAAAPAPRPAPTVEVGPAAPRQPEPGARATPPVPNFEPVLEPRDRPSPSRAETYADEIEAPDRGEDYRSAGRRRSWLTPLVALAALAAILLGGWWAISAGWLQMSADGTPPQVAEEDAAPENGGEPPRIPGGADDLRDWIVVFEPSDPTTVAAPGDTSAEVMEEDGEQFMRITSGPSGAPILFDVGQGVLEQIAGGRAVFNIVAQAPDGEETEISVDCNLGELGDCGRKRYAVGATREEFLFEMELPEVDPGAGGTIAINPDIDGGGKSVDIHGIRVTAAE